MRLRIFLQNGLMFFLLVPMLKKTHELHQITELQPTGNGVSEIETEAKLDELPGNARS